jgi:hypothetical protein
VLLLLLQVLPNLLPRLVLLRMTLREQALKLMLAACRLLLLLQLMRYELLLMTLALLLLPAIVLQEQPNLLLRPVLLRLTLHGAMLQFGSRIVIHHFSILEISRRFKT